MIHNLYIGSGEHIHERGEFFDCIFIAKDPHQREIIYSLNEMKRRDLNRTLGTFYSVKITR